MAVDIVYVILSLAVGFIIGGVFGFIHGMKREKKAFYKYPSSHWKIRGK